MRLPLLCLIFFALALLPDLVDAQEAEPATRTPDAEKLHSKHLAAIGGLEALKKVKSIRMKGNVSIPQMNLVGQVLAYEVPPKRQYIETMLPNLGKTIQVMDGARGWVKTANGVRELAASQIAQQQLQAELQRGAKLADVFQSAKTRGLEHFEGADAYAVDVVSKEGQKMTLFYAKDSGLMSGISASIATANGPFSTTITTSDYRVTGPVKTAHASTIKMGPSEVRMVMSEVEINGEVPETLFAVPEELRKAKPSTKP